MPSGKKAPQKGAVCTSGPKGHKPRQGVKAEAKTNRRAGVKCHKCGKAASYLGRDKDRWIVCSSDSEHNKSFPFIVAERAHCNKCKAPTPCITYPGKTWCKVCKTTTEGVGQSQPPKKAPRVRSDEVKKGSTYADAVKSKPQRNVEPRAYTNGAAGGEPTLIPGPKTKKVGRSKEVKVDVSKGVIPKKPKTETPPPLPPKNKVRWVEKYGWTSDRVYVIDSKASVGAAQETIRRQIKCYECEGRSLSVWGWKESEDFVYRGNKGLKPGKVWVAGVRCFKQQCQCETKVYLMRVSPPKKEFLSLEHPKGKPIVTAQSTKTVWSESNPKPVDLSEDQCKVLALEAATRLGIREALREALSSANQDFQKADTKARSSLAKKAKQVMVNISGKLPKSLNVRWKGKQIRTMPMRWNVTRRGVLNPVYSVLMGLLSESDKINDEDLLMLQDICYHSVMMEPVAKKRSKPKIKLDTRDRPAAQDRTQVLDTSLFTTDQGTEVETILLEETADE